MKTLNDILTEERLREGWRLNELGGTVLELLYQGKLIARFNQTKITIEDLEHEINKIVRRNNANRGRN